MRGGEYSRFRSPTLTFKPSLEQVVQYPPFFRPLSSQGAIKDPRLNDGEAMAGTATGVMEARAEGESVSQPAGKLQILRATVCTRSHAPPPSSLIPVLWDQTQTTGHLEQGWCELEPVEQPKGRPEAWCWEGTVWRRPFKRRKAGQEKVN